MITVKHLTKAYGDKQVIKDLSFMLPERGVVRILGESGVGKTTLLNILAGIELPDDGVIEITGSISMVFQEDRLLNDISAIENVMIATLKNTDMVSRKPGIILAEMGLENDFQTKAGNLSGGMARRVAIARALAKEADIYIMDEPIKGMDEQTTEQVIQIIEKYTKEKLLIVVTHNPEEFSNSDNTLIL